MFYTEIGLQVDVAVTMNDIFLSSNEMQIVSKKKDNKNERRHLNNRLLEMELAISWFFLFVYLCMDLWKYVEVTCVPILSLWAIVAHW